MSAAVRTRLRSLIALATTKGILEGSLVPCQVDLVLALQTLQRCMTQLEGEHQTKQRRCKSCDIDMPSIEDIAAGMKLRLLADLDVFPEGTEGTVKEVRAHDDQIWHAIVTWSDKNRKRRIRGVLKPNDLDYIEIIPRKTKFRPVQLPIPFPD